jgi:hypothetical protein
MADFSSELEQFRLGLRRRESGGNYTVRNKIGASGAYQYMPGTWRSWAGPALARQYPEAWMAPPAIQDEVARRNMSALYHQFGSWFKVAKAWLGGPGNVDKNFSDGSVTQNQYAAQVLAYAGLSGAPGATADMGMASGVPSTEAASAQQAATDQQIESDRHDLGAQVQSLLDMLDRAGNTDPTDPNAPAPETPTDTVLRRVQDASAA